MPETQAPSLIEQIFVLSIGSLLMLTLWTVLLWKYIYAIHLKWKVNHNFNSLSREDLFLSKHQPFYAQLSTPNKKKFLYRLLRLKSISKFINRSKTPLHKGHKMLVLSSKVQLTFGLEKLFFSQLLPLRNLWRPVQRKFQGKRCAV
jgi:hypothetical protein